MQVQLNGLALKMIPQQMHSALAKQYHSGRKNAAEHTSAPYVNGTAIKEHMDDFDAGDRAFYLFYDINTMKEYSVQLPPNMTGAINQAVRNSTVYKDGRDNIKSEPYGTIRCGEYTLDIHIHLVLVSLRGIRIAWIRHEYFNKLSDDIMNCGGDVTAHARVFNAQWSAK